MPETTSQKDTTANSFNNDACDSCPQSHACRDVWAKPNQGPFSPGGLILASILAFIVPIITAVIAAAIVRHNTDPTGHTAVNEILAALAGLLAGVALAWRVMPCIKKHFPAPRPDTTHCAPTETTQQPHSNPTTHNYD